MTSLLEASRDLFHQVFVRDEHRCVYCDTDILQSLDTFASSHLDHLQPRRAGGKDEFVNCVTACGVCNTMKGGFDPSFGKGVTAETFHEVVREAREYVQGKRNGTTACSYVRDYAYWLQHTGRSG